ncbi:MAG: lytic transglycosylase domain-containing protein [Proteobacteria bacterium]|nr:lytic transglycosylase domain-containing protein [Pseudomonadota bacterium]
MLKKIVLTLFFILTCQNLYSLSLGNKINFENITSIEFKKAKERVSDYFLMKEAKLLEEKNEDEAIRIYETIINNYANTPNYKKALRRLIEIKLKRNDEDLLYYSEKYISKFSDHDLMYKLAGYFLAVGKKERAIELFRYIFNSSDLYSVRALKRLKELNTDVSDRERQNVVMRLYEKQLFDEIIELNKISGFFSKEERMALIKSLFRTKRYKNVAELTRNETEWSLKEMYLLSILRMGQKEDFIKEVEELFRKGEKAFFNLYLLYADIKKRDEEFDEALKFLNQLKEFFPDKKELISWEEALILIRTGDFRRAEEILSDLSDKYQSNRYLFWLGKVMDYQGKDGSPYYNMMKDEEDYYYLKKKKLNNKEKKSYPSKKDERISALLLLDMKEEAREELTYYLSKNSNDELLFVDYLKRLELYNYLLKIGTKQNDIYLKYPLAYYELIFDISERHNIDPLIALAVMREESHFRKNAVSSAKAYGLMQIIYPTAKKFNKNITEDGLFAEEKNIDIGVRYLAFLLKKFKNKETAICAYNAGEHNVEKWLNNGYKDIDEFIENIPFLETRGYVKKVMRSYYIYKGLYGR